MFNLLRLASICAALSANGCSGSFQTGPIPTRLDPEAQATIDSSWNNALNPPHRLDRTLLLDVLMSGHLYWFGVDQLNARVEKKVDSGRVVMVINYDRALSDNADAFTVTHYDQFGGILRMEQYSRADIDDRQWLYGFRLDPKFESDEEEKAKRSEEQAKIDARMWEIRTATQPAGWDGDSDE